MYTVKTSSGNTIALNKAEIAGESFEGDIIQIDETSFHVIHLGHSYNAEVVSVDPEEKKVELSINGKRMLLEIQDQYDLLLQKMGISAMSARKVNSIKAPMPGLVVEVKVAVGDTVQKGDTILILEAMKMENIIKSPTDGVVGKIAVEKGQAVEKNELMIGFEG